MAPARLTPPEAWTRRVSSVSRKHYNEAAQILRETAMPAETRSQLVARFVTMFADDNARFSPSRFREASEPASHFVGGDRRRTA